MGRSKSSWPRGAPVTRSRGPGPPLGHELLIGHVRLESLSTGWLWRKCLTWPVGYQMFSDIIVNMLCHVCCIQRYWTSDGTSLLTHFPYYPVSRSHRNSQALLRESSSFSSSFEGVHSFRECMCNELRCGFFADAFVQQALKPRRPRSVLPLAGSTRPPL
jgi:hypothetical protein